jgi:hypothetical protein
VSYNGTLWRYDFASTRRPGVDVEAEAAMNLAIGQDQRPERGGDRLAEARLLAMMELWLNRRGIGGTDAEALAFDTLVEVLDAKLDALGWAAVQRLAFARLQKRRVDYLRVAGRRKRHERRAAGPSAMPAPDDAAARQDTRRMVDRLFAELEDDLRILASLHDEPEKAVAMKLGLTIKGVRAARVRLKRALVRTAANLRLDVQALLEE